MKSDPQALFETIGAALAEAGVLLQPIIGLDVDAATGQPPSVPSDLCVFGSVRMGEGVCHLALHPHIQRLMILDDEAVPMDSGRASATTVQAFVGVVAAMEERLRFESGMSDEAPARTRIRILSHHAATVFGADWQTALARALGPLHPGKARETLDPSLVRKWLRGERPIPLWVDDAMRQIMAIEAMASLERTIALLCSAMSPDGFWIAVPKLRAIQIGLETGTLAPPPEKMLVDDDGKELPF